MHNPSNPEDTMTVTITEAGSNLVVSTPYVEEFPPAARKIGGRWNGSDKTWIFDSRDTDRVKSLCRNLFGTAGAEDEADLITVQIKLDELNQPAFFECANGSSYANRIRWCGRVIAHRASRDGDVDLGDGVRLVAGTFEYRGGSVKNPALGDLDGVELEVRDVPRLMFDQLPDTDGVTVLDTTVDREALAAERTRLLERLAEITAILGE